ncbi:outer membrane beta-barrel protein [Pontibacter pamirensis]|uniref:outer membrane beta-barrel protein n=1 Tax=Pontibacter pamirensis TaxID=2562824 RepID=UPI00138A113B|nr:outer membrane beta-barrel protein [Pontibacter pamirensis]
MFQKTKFLTALLFSLLVAAVSVEAQSHKPKFRSQYNIKKRSIYGSKSSPGISFIAGTGMSVLNSDNRGHNFGDDGLRPFRNNGFGPNASLGVMYMFTPIIGVLGSFDYNGFKASEGETDNKDVSFKSHTLQASGSLVVNLIDGYSGFGSNKRRSILIPYVKVGLGVARYKASSYFEDENGTLPALKDYPSVAAVVPIGAGLNIQCSKEFSVAPEINFTFTSTDYLDNMVNEAGYSGENDHFLTASVKALYTPDFRGKRFRRNNR